MSFKEMDVQGRASPSVEASSKEGGECPEGKDIGTGKEQAGCDYNEKGDRRDMYVRNIEQRDRQESVTR